MKVIDDVQTCTECPFNNRTYDDDTCKIADDEHIDDMLPFEEPPPEWCPLRKSSVLVSLDRSLYVPETFE